MKHRHLALKHKVADAENGSLCTREINLCDAYLMSKRVAKMFSSTIKGLIKRTTTKWQDHLKHVFSLKAIAW